MIPASASAVGILAAVLGAVRLDRRPLWMDEAFDVHFTTLGWSEYLEVVREFEMSQALYLLALKPWLAIATTDEWAARVPSVVFAAAACALMVPLGARLLGSRLAGVVAGLFLACNAFSVEWSQQARTYTLAMLAAVVVTYLFVRAAESSSWGRWIAYGVGAGLAVYAHFVVAFVLAAHYPALIALGRLSAVKRWLVGASLAFLVAAPAFDFAVNNDRGQTGWVPPLSRRVVNESVEALAGGNGVFLGLAMLGVALAVQRSGRSTDRWRLVLTAAWVTIPFLLALGISLFKPLFTDRYLIVVLPALSLAGALVVTSGGRPAAVAATVVVLVVALQRVGDWYTGFVEQDWRAAAALVERRAAPPDTIVVQPAWLAPVAGYYLKEPPETDGLSPGTTWILSFIDRRAEIDAYVRGAGHTIEERLEVPGVDVYRVVRRPRS